jgi:hypothetical protein
MLSFHVGDEVAPRPGGHDDERYADPELAECGITRPCKARVVAR